MRSLNNHIFVVLKEKVKAILRMPVLKRKLSTASANVNMNGNNSNPPASLEPEHKERTRKYSEGSSRPISDLLFARSRFNVGAKKDSDKSKQKRKGSKGHADDVQKKPSLDA